MPWVNCIQTNASWSVDDLTGIATVAIALCAIFFTYWQVRVVKKHNKLSVRPNLTIWTHSESSSYSVELINNGVGPAIIGCLLVFVDGTRLQGKEFEPFKEAIDILFPASMDSCAYAWVSKGYCMAANERRALVSIKFKANAVPSKQAIDEALSRVRLVIHYASIYEEQPALDTETLRKEAS